MCSPSRQRLLSSRVPHAAGLGSDDHGCPVGARERIDHLESEVAEQHAPDCFDLKVRELGAHAAMATATKPNEGEGNCLVLITRRCKREDRKYP